MSRGLVALLGVVLLALPVPVEASPDVPTSGAAAATASTLAATSVPARSGEATTITWTLGVPAGASVQGRSLVLERWRDGAWHPTTTLVTDAAGQAVAQVTLAPRPDHNRFRATVPADETGEAVTGEHTVPLRRWASTLALRAPASVVDERRATIRVQWQTEAGQPVRGWVRLQVKQRRVGAYAAKGKPTWQKKWRRVARVRTDAQGRAEFVRRPRWDTRWRVVAAPPKPWVAGATSRVALTRNRAPGRPVALPGRAPRPRVQLPPQRRAVGQGANVKVKRIGPKVWRAMRGRSWRPGCPVGRAGLRLVEVNYWAFDGYRRRGQMVVAAGVTRNFAGAFTEMHARGIPVRSMYRVDRFGWSRRLGGADDYRSMAADNTSVFNCRGVVGNPGVRSPHSYGRSLDLNPWENPYFSRTGVVPNRWWVSRSHPRVAWRSHRHEVVRLLARHGFRWTYGRSDAHHFDAVAGAGGAPLRDLLSSPVCARTVCH